MVSPTISKSLEWKVDTRTIRVSGGDGEGILAVGKSELW